MIELINLLVAKALFMLMNEILCESIEEIYGIFGFQKDC
jgi:hypothetical protein